MQLLHADAHLLAVAKPAGIPVIPARTGDPGECLHKRLEASRGERLWVVHRLDRDTSGVVLFARRAETHRALSLAFERREVTKVYRAFTLGVPDPPAGEIDLPMHEGRKGRMRPAREGEPGAIASRTGYALMARRDSALGPVALVEARPHTGRQHQIRVHLRAKGAALLVDPLYGEHERIDAGALGAGSPAIERLTLHALRIEFVHPALRVPVAFEAPLPEDLAALERWIRPG